MKKSSPLKKVLALAIVAILGLALCACVPFPVTTRPMGQPKGPAAPKPAAQGAKISGPATVAAVLPLSDPSAGKYARAVEAGLKLALAGGGIKVVTLDTGGTAEGAAAAVKKAAADPAVAAAVGPILSREAGEAARAAQAAGLPLIAISQSLDVTKAGNGVFRLFLTPKHQAEAVARYAVKEQGHKALGVLAPGDAYGRAMAAWFEAEAKRQGAAVTAKDSYDAKAGDWGEAVSRLTGGQAARQASASYQAETGFTALYMPDSAGVVAQILPLIAYHDVTRMQYLGSPLWFNQELARGSSARYIQGAVIPVALTALSGRPETRDFMAAYQAQNGQAPDQFAAYGFDAGLALAAALAKGDSRETVRQALARTRSLPGAIGTFGFGPDGEYAVEPTLITLEGKTFALLRDAL